MKYISYTELFNLSENLKFQLKAVPWYRFIIRRQQRERIFTLDTILRAMMERTAGIEIQTPLSVYPRGN